ncbi:MAG: Na+/H+ antiporter subunit E [Burkholderiales bacterium]|nr:Na+/H+ antiporter subunit E [Burkholderiales bacterium]
MGTAFARFLGFAALWVVLVRGVAPADLAVGVLAAAVATWASLRLLPAEAGRVNLGALALRLPRFLWQSVVAGVDVARRALAPGVPLRLGFVGYRTGFARGAARNAFATITSLMPGTVPVDDTEAEISYHCLDVGQPVAAQLAAEEREYADALAPGKRLG